MLVCIKLTDAVSSDGTDEGLNDGVQCEVIKEIIQQELPETLPSGVTFTGQDVNFYLRLGAIGRPSLLKPALAQLHSNSMHSACTGRYTYVEDLVGLVMTLKFEHCSSRFCTQLQTGNFKPSDSQVLCAV